MTLLRRLEHQPWHRVPKLKSISTLETMIMTKLNQSQRKTRSLVMVAGALAMVALVGACNTVEGFGRDTERAGESLQNKAK
jgi:predicted small secreted protein